MIKKILVCFLCLTVYKQVHNMFQPVSNCCLLLKSYHLLEIKRLLTPVLLTKMSAPKDQSELTKVSAQLVAVLRRLYVTELLFKMHFLALSSWKTVRLIYNIGLRHCLQR